MKIIAIDAGNTHLRFAEIDTENPQNAEIIHSNYDNVFTELENYDFPISISSVVPKGKELYESLSETHKEIYFCERKIIENRIIPKINYSETLGIDRIVDAIAGLKLFPNRDLIIIDSGTATTIDCVGAKGEFFGGFILPGIKITSEAIHEKTAVLPKLNPFDLKFVELPQDTFSAVSSGLIADCAGGIEYAIEICEKKLDNPIILGCGGGWEIIKKYVRKPTRSIPALTLIGTALAAAAQPLL
jgi:type III pantothenate kinase